MSTNKHSYIDRDTLYALSRLNPIRSGSQIVVEWALIAAAIVAHLQIAHPLSYLLLVVWIGARQNALAVLMHDAAHHRLLPHKRWNDIIGELLLAWPIGVSLDSYRSNHFAHHRHVNRPEDPDWQRKQNSHFVYPKPASELLWITFRYLSGSYVWQSFASAPTSNRRASGYQRVARPVFYLGLIGASILFNFWFGLLLYWIVPLFTYFLWAIYLRGVAEHFGGIENNGELVKMTRHIDTNVFGKLLLAPNNVSYHIAHHLYPTVPFYNLPKLQNALLKNTYFCRDAHVTRGYSGLLRELVATR